MSFLFPSFLWALAALSIPVLIHLFNFQRPKKVFFTNVKFLRDVKETTTSKLKLKHFLVLLARLAFITFLVLAFAQPFIHGKNPTIGSDSGSNFLYLDNSLSMENEVANERALDVGIKALSGLGQLFSSDANYLLLTNDFEGKDQFFRNKEKLEERLTEISFSGLSRSADAVLKRQQSVSDRFRNKKGNVFWFSDFQKTQMGDLDKISFDSSSSFFLIPVQNQSLSNVFIDSVWISEPVVRLGEKNNIEVLLSNTGENDISGLPVKFFLDDVLVGTASTDLKAGSSSKTSFSFQVSEKTAKRGVIRIEDQPVRFDNEYYFIINPASVINIYHIFEGADNSVNKLYSNEEAFNVSSVPSGQVDYTALTSNHLLVLENINNISGALEEAIGKHVKKGGSVVIFPGAEHSNLLKFLSSLTGSIVNEANADTSQYGISIATPDFKDPFFQDFFDREEKNLNMPEASPVIHWNSRGRTLLSLKNGKPFLGEFNIGAGKVYLFSTPVRSAYTNFLRHSLFVPVMYKIAFNSYSAGERLAFNLDESVIAVNIPDPEGEEIFSFKSEEFSVIPSQRIQNRRLIIEVPADKLKPGFYNVSSDKNGKLVAFNYGKKESQMQFYSSDELKTLFKENKNVTVYDVEDSEEFFSEFKNDNIGIALWKYCLILALLFLLTEIFLIRLL